MKRAWQLPERWNDHDLQTHNVTADYRMITVRKSAETCRKHRRGRWKLVRCGSVERGVSAGSHPDKQTVLGESFEFPLRERERPRDRLRERERERGLQ